jgi:mono/diheme cytochrome c family protein
MRRLRSLALAAVLVALLLPLGGCGGASSHARPARAQAAARARHMRLGAQVFAQNCATCHPLLGQPNTGYHSDAPPVDLDQLRMTRRYVNDIVGSGKVGMGSFSQLPPDRFRAVVDYVLAVGGREVGVPSHVPAAVLARGRALYDAHCQACHAMLGRKPTHPNQIWAAPPFEDVRPSVADVELMVREGQREAMPSFRRLPGEDVRAVALYVNAMALRRR